MILSLTISISRLLKECIDQTSHDFRAMRLANIETADALYDDFAMTEENAEDIVTPIEECGTDMLQELRTLLKEYVITDDMVYVEIDCANERVGSASLAESYMRQFFKYRILLWWYTSRESNLATLYAEKAGNALGNLFTHCVPRTGTIPQRYF